MHISYLKRFLQNQFVSGIAASLTLIVVGASFVWPSPILHLFDEHNHREVLIPMTASETSWMMAIIEISCVFSTIIFGFLSDLIGRKPCIWLAYPFLLAGWILILTTRDVYSLYIVRLLHGVPLGIMFTVVPVYLGEIAEAKVRGALTALQQIMLFAGFLLQFVIGSYLSYNNSAIFNIVLSAVIFVFYFLFSPESPYYLTMKRRDDKAQQSLMVLRGKSTTNEVENEMKNIKECVDKDMENTKKWSDTFKMSTAELKILVIVQIILFLREATGLIAFASYISDILLNARLDNSIVKGTMVAYAISMVLFAGTTMFIIDFLGRRPLLIISCIGIGFCNLLLGCFFLYDSKFNLTDSNHKFGWTASILLICFTGFFGMGLGPVAQTVQSEMFPTNIRALGNLVSSLTTSFASFVAIRSYQIINEFIGFYINFFIFSALSFFGAIYIYLQLPETKGKTFLEISIYINGDNEKRNQTMKTESSKT